VSCYCLLGDWALLGDVDSVEELSQILITNVGALLDLRSRETHERDVVTTQLDLVLHVRRSDVSDALQKLHLTHTLLPAEVADFDDVACKRHVDGEVAVHKAHLIDEALGDAHEHVIDVRADRSDACQLLAVGEPQVDANAFGAYAAEVHVDVLEIADESAAFARDGDDASLNVDLDCAKLSTIER
jgi:hypothetical protein